MLVNSSLGNIYSLSCLQYLYLGSGPLSHAPVYCDATTKNMNNYLTLHHGVMKDHTYGVYELSAATSELRIVADFGHSDSPELPFKTHIFKQMLIQWMYVTNTAFYAIEDPPSAFFSYIF